MIVDLASRALGGSVVAASDESFGVKERLIEPGEPAFVPGTYDDRGEVVDGWETRRHAHGDWAIVRLGVGGRLRTIDVDTRFFSGNQPTGCRVAACVLDPAGNPPPTTSLPSTMHAATRTCDCSWNPMGESRDYGRMATSSRTQRCGTTSPSRCQASSRAVASNGPATVSIPM